MERHKTEGAGRGGSTREEADMVEEGGETTAAATGPGEIGAAAAGEGESGAPPVGADTMVKVAGEADPEGVKGLE